MWFARSKCDSSMEIAKEAIRRVEDITKTQEISHVAIRSELKEAIKEWNVNSQEWRVSLGRRLDKQDEDADNRVLQINRLLYSGLGFLILTLLGVVGFFIERLPIFK